MGLFLFQIASLQLKQRQKRTQRDAGRQGLGECFCVHPLRCAGGAAQQAQSICWLNRWHVGGVLIKKN